MPRGRWKENPQSLAEEAYTVLIEREKVGRKKYSRTDLKARLIDPEVRLPFLQFCMEFDDTASLVRFRKGLFLSIQAIGMTKVAKDAQIHRVTLYRMLTPGGNPGLESLMRILRALGHRIWVLDDEFFWRRSKVVRPKNVRQTEFLKVSTGRRVWTRNRFNRDPEDNW